MNKHVAPDKLGTPQLTPAERVEALIDAVTLYDIKRLQSLKHAEDIGWNTCAEIATVGELRLDQLVDEEVRAHDAVVATARTLMSGGLLERCAKLLKADAAGRL